LTFDDEIEPDWLRRSHGSCNSQLLIGDGNL
jgi:hypothetical protein